MKILIEIEPNDVIIKISKLEENTNICDGEHYYYNHKKFDNLNGDELFEIFKILLFRKIIGINDTCERNINYNNMKSFSIDDPCTLS